MAETVRLISATGNDIMQMSAPALKESIYKSEGRVIMGQHLLFAGSGTVRGITNTELMRAWGADMVILNTIDLDDLAGNNPGLCGLTIPELKEKVKIPLGVYLGCPKAGETPKSDRALYRNEGMVASKEHIQKCLALGVDFILLGGNPGSGTCLSDVIAWTRKTKEIVGDKCLIFAGKWEDGITEKVLSDPTAEYDAEEVVRELIDAGADCIDLPCPGSRGGITVEDVRHLVQVAHTYKKGTLAMCFLDSSVECADEDTIRQIAILMKETGADIHAIGDGGFGGCSWPKNVYQLSVSIKGAHYTWFRMGSVNR